MVLGFNLSSFELKSSFLLNPKVLDSAESKFYSYFQIRIRPNPYLFQNWNSAESKSQFLISDLAKSVCAYLNNWNLKDLSCLLSYYNTSFK